MPRQEENQLTLQANFIERAFAYSRWQDMSCGRKLLPALIDFHTKHKFLLLAHSEIHYRRLGRIVAAAKQSPLSEVYREYGNVFKQALAVHATAKKHANVLDHMLGFFSDQLSSAERSEVVESIAAFRRRLVPLIVPLTLLRHYVKKFAVKYLLEQIYLAPSPRELMLRTRV